MPKRSKRVLPIHRFCVSCRKDSYPDRVAAELALDYLSINPHRGNLEPTRFYSCPRGRGFHLTSRPKNPTFSEAVDQSA